jgi:hypothetical protein
MGTSMVMVSAHSSGVWGGAHLATAAAQPVVKALSGPRMVCKRAASCRRGKGVVSNQW